MGGGIFVGHPSGIDGVHVDAVLHKVRRARPGHHVERRLRHVGMRVLVGLGGAIELALDALTLTTCLWRRTSAP